MEGRPGPGPHSPTTAPVRWFPDALPVLLVPAHSNDRALVILADSTASAFGEGSIDSTAILIRLDGGQVSGRVTILESDAGCVEAAVDPAPSRSWGAGFIGGAPHPLAVDSLGGITRIDSSLLTRIAFRVASAVPNEDGGRFAGLAFSLVDLWRIHLPGRRSALIASVKRQLNQEDSPLQERTFIIAEADSGSGDDYSLVHSTRSSGAEETVESRELTAAFAFPAQPVGIVVAQDFGDQRGFTILERTASGRWAVRWASRRLSC